MRHTIGFGIVGIAMVMGASGSARGGYVLNIQEVGADVVATGSGTFDTTDLIRSDAGGYTSLEGAQGLILIGGPVAGQHNDADGYVALSGPLSFGNSAGIATETAGDFVGLYGGVTLFTPRGYVSGSHLSSYAKWEGQTFASLRLVPSSFVWTWGSGDHADSFTLNIGVASVPEPASLAMVGVGLLAVAGYVARGRRAG